MLWKSTRDTKIFLNIIIFFVFSLNLATFLCIARKRKQRRKSMIGPSGVSLGEHLFAHSKTENVPPKCCQKHTQDEQIVDFRLCFCFLRVRENIMILMPCCEKNTPVTKIVFNIIIFSFLSSLWRYFGALLETETNAEINDWSLWSQSWREFFTHSRAQNIPQK